MGKECLAWPGALSAVLQGKSGASSGLSQAFHALSSPTVTTVNPYSQSHFCIFFSLTEHSPSDMQRQAVPLNPGF